LVASFGNVIVVSIRASLMFREDQQVIDHYDQAALTAIIAVVFSALSLNNSNCAASGT
jgi:hypothetical protein